MPQNQTLIRNVIAFVAAGILVFTGVYIYWLWHNQSAARVLGQGNLQLVYETSDMAVGEPYPSSEDTASPIRNPVAATASTGSQNGDWMTLLRYTPDGGWLIEGRERWIAMPHGTNYVQVTVVPNQSAFSTNAEWLCVLRKDPRVTAIKLVNRARPNASDTFSFHQGGIIEPISVDPGAVLKGLHGRQVLFSIPLSTVPH